MAVLAGVLLAHSAGARIYERGGNAVDAACAMLSATATMFDVLSCCGETQALVYHPVQRQVIAVNALGVAPTGDRTLLQFFLNVVEFGMTVQEAAEAANIVSYQLRDSFGDHAARPGVMVVNEQVPSWVRRDLVRRGYTLEVEEKPSGPITAIYFDRAHGTFWGGSSDHGEDYGLAW